MKVLILQHTAGEHPAAFSDHIAQAGDTARTVHLYRGETIPNIARFDAMIVMGGPMDVWDTTDYPWLRAEKSIIATWVRVLRRPYLGICLGHQLLIDALSGKCTIMSKPEIGVREIEMTEAAAEDPIFAGYGNRMPVMQWHGVEAAIVPDDTTVLARNSACALQAIRVGAHAWGVQFHPELTSELVSGWLEDPGNYACAVEWLGSEDLARRFAWECEAHVDTAQLHSRALYAGLRQAAVKAAAQLEWTGK